MRKTIVALYVFLFLFLISCEKGAFVSDLSGSAILKDQSVVRYELVLEFEHQKGVHEFIEKRDKINHAMRIILAQRNEDQIDKQSRLISVAIKIFKSQLSEPVKHITVKTFEIDKLM